MPQGYLHIYWRLAINSLVLSGLAAGAAIVLAVVLANGIRINSGRLTRFIARLTTMGYAVPGDYHGCQNSGSHLKETLMAYSSSANRSWYVGRRDLSVCGCYERAAYHSNA